MASLKLGLWAACAAASIGLAAYAQDSRPTAGPGAAPDAELGRQLASVGNQGGAAPCAQCHGMDGAGDPANAFPRLTGQSGAYLYKQLNDYASEARPHPIMTAIAQAMTDQERQGASAYYAAMRGPEPPQAAADDSAVRQGEQLSMTGDASKGLQACANCHGPAGIGLPPLIPRLSGQHASYTQQQLEQFREGTRHNDVAGVMREISRKLSDEDIAALAAYLQNVRPPVAAAASDGHR